MTPTGEVLVAGSLPPVFESYRPDLFDATLAPAILDVLVAGLAPHIDLWLIETQSSTAEAGVAIGAAQKTGLPIWVSYTLRMRWADADRRSFGRVKPPSKPSPSGWSMVPRRFSSIAASPK